MTDEEKLAEEYTEISLNENEYEECLIDFHDIVILKESIKKAYLVGLNSRSNRQSNRRGCSKQSNACMQIGA